MGNGNLNWRNANLSELPGTYKMQNFSLIFATLHPSHYLIKSLHMLSSFLVFREHLKCINMAKHRVVIMVIRQAESIFGIYIGPILFHYGAEQQFAFAFCLSALLTKQSIILSKP